MGTKNLDDAYLEYYKYKNSDREYVLTVNGYEPLERNFIENVAFYSKDIGKGVVRGGAKLSEGILSLLTAASEKFILGPEAMKKLDPEGDGLVKDLGEFYKNNVYSKIGETETLAGGFAEGLSQFLVPGVGYYKLFNSLLKAPAMANLLVKSGLFTTRALAAEAATVGTAQVAGEGNFVSFLADAFQIETKDAETLTSRYLEYLRTPEDVSEGVDADKVLAEKWKAIQGDIALGPVGEAMGPLLTKFFSTMKKLKSNNKNTIKAINDKMPPAQSTYLSGEAYPTEREIEELGLSKKLVKGEEKLDRGILEYEKKVGIKNKAKDKRFINVAPEIKKGLVEE
tara:strand:- start:6096 stop:7115 length:1020 start_codon:yes stop_codon:yes gene_type:complete